MTGNAGDRQAMMDDLAQADHEIDAAVKVVNAAREYHNAYLYRSVTKATQKRHALFMAVAYLDDLMRQGAKNANQR